MKKVIFSLIALMTAMVMNGQVKQTYLTLNNGVQMPQFGLGVYSIPDGDETYNSVMTALKCGYRHIDTAHAYQNERSVGRAVKDSGIDRSEIWITSKLWPNEYGEGKTLKAIDRMGGRESKGELLRDPVICEIAKAHGKSPAQIIIRWHMQMGFSVIPGASNPDYIQENIETFDFALSNHEMERIHLLNKEKRYFNMSYEDQVKWFSQFNPTD